MSVDTSPNRGQGLHLLQAPAAAPPSMTPKSKIRLRAATRQIAMLSPIERCGLRQEQQVGAEEAQEPGHQVQQPDAERGSTTTATNRRVTFTILAP